MHYEEAHYSQVRYMANVAGTGFDPSVTKIYEHYKAQGRRGKHLYAQGSVKSFFRFLKRVPGFLWLNRFHDVNPDFYSWVIQQYQTVMREMTGGSMNDPSYGAMAVIDGIWNYMNGHFAGWFKEEKQQTEADEKPE